MADLLAAGVPVLRLARLGRLFPLCLARQPVSPRLRIDHFFAKHQFPGSVHSPASAFGRGVIAGGEFLELALGIAPFNRIVPTHPGNGVVVPGCLSRMLESVAPRLAPLLDPLPLPKADFGPVQIKLGHCHIVNRRLFKRPLLQHARTVAVLHDRLLAAQILRDGLEIRVPHFKRSTRDQ